VRATGSKINYARGGNDDINRLSIISDPRQTMLASQEDPGYSTFVNCMRLPRYHVGVCLVRTLWRKW
jgi:hypothetical protein